MNTELVNLIRKGGIAVIPTDTIYGIVGSALSLETVERIYQLRKRVADKPMIILIFSLDDLKKFDILLTEKQQEFLKSHWPNPLSVILPIQDGKFEYLHRGTKSLAFRMPKNKKLLELLKQIGPLVAPSANFEGEKPSETINEAKNYFANDVFYMDGGKMKSQPSTMIRLEDNGSYQILRQGKYKL